MTTFEKIEAILGDMSYEQAFYESLFINCVSPFVDGIALSYQLPHREGNKIERLITKSGVQIIVDYTCKECKLWFEAGEASLSLFNNVVLKEINIEKAMKIADKIKALK